jgi:hypothetical protein
MQALSAPVVEKIVQGGILLVTPVTPVPFTRSDFERLLQRARDLSFSA